MQFYWSKAKKQDRTFPLSSLWDNGSGTVTPWADSTVVLSAKVNCRPWMTVLFALGTSVIRNIISLSIHVPYTHSRLLYFKHKQLHDQSNLEPQTINIINVQIHLI